MSYTKRVIATACVAGFLLIGIPVAATYIPSIEAIPTRDHHLLTGLDDDDHPQYLKRTETISDIAVRDHHLLDGLTDDDHIQYLKESGSIAEITTRDHDLLTGLTDDDHTQYLKESGSIDEITTRDHHLLTGLTDDDHTQYLKESGSIAEVTTRDHDLLSGLTDDDHSQYALLAGRSGGQELHGGTAAGENLTLTSTSHVSTGNIYFGKSTYEEATSQLGIGTTDIPAGGYGAAQLQLDGVDSSTSGPHMQFSVAEGRPMLQILPWTSDNVSLNFDAYYDGSWKSADAGSNVQLAKFSDAFSIKYDSGVVLDGAITWNTAVAINATNGRVGIGTDSPDKDLHITSTGNTAFRMERNDTTVTLGNTIGAIQFEHQDADDAGVAAKIVAQGDGSSGEAGITFYTGTPSSQVLNMLVDSDGYVGMGNSDPDQRLHVLEDRASNFAAMFHNDGNNVNRYGIVVLSGLDDQDAGSTINYCLHYRDSDNGADQGYLRNNNGTFELAQASDKKRKEDIQDTVVNALARIAELELKQFRYKTKKKETQGVLHPIGFIAQDVQEVIPEAVAVGTDGSLFLAQSALIPYLTKATQEQQEQVEYQQVIISELLARIVALEAQVGGE